MKYVVIIIIIIIIIIIMLYGELLAWILYIWSVLNSPDVISQSALSPNMFSSRV